MNHVVLMGRLTRDPELRRTQSGTPVAAFTLAVDRGFVTGDGERKTDFIDCVAWRKTADFVANYFVKGQLAAVIGRLHMRIWTDDVGTRRKNAEVVVDTVYFTGDRRYECGTQKEPDADVRDFSQVPTSEFQELEELDGELPF